jgi:hypothetical protein
MEKHYELDEVTRHRILELIKTCSVLELGNVSFKYYKELIDFYMLEEGDHWQLVVVLPFGKRDVYKIAEGIITHEYSGEEEPEEDEEAEDADSKKEN